MYKTMKHFITFYQQRGLTRDYIYLLWEVKTTIEYGLDPIDYFGNEEIEITHQYFKEILG